MEGAGAAQKKNTDARKESDNRPPRHDFSRTSGPQLAAVLRSRGGRT